MNSFDLLCRNAGFIVSGQQNKHEIAEFLGVSVRQVERYINGANIHASAKKLLELKSVGIIDNKKWCGFAIRDDKLITPNGDYFSKNDLESFGLTHQIKCSLLNEIERLERTNKRLTNKIKKISG